MVDYDKGVCSFSGVVCVASHWQVELVCFVFFFFFLVFWDVVPFNACLAYKKKTTAFFLVS